LFNTGSGFKYMEALNRSVKMAKTAKA